MLKFLSGEINMTKPKHKKLKIKNQTKTVVLKISFA